MALLVYPKSCHQLSNSNFLGLHISEFSRGLPWIAQIADRTEQGLEEIWVLVEKVTDSVLCMDPYPWDDVDEEFELELSDFLTRWKLCNCTAIHLP